MTTAAPMQRAGMPGLKRLLLLGGGHAHVHVLRELAARRCRTAW